jgi:hypothetical protein
VILYLIRNKHLNKEPIQSEESAKLHPDEDKLSRRVFAKSVADYIQSTRNNQKDSFAIGIEGKWGTGKSTLMNFVTYYLREKSTIVINFNPWYSTSPQALINDFFTTVREELFVYNPELSISLRKYAHLLTKYYDKNRAIESLIDCITGYPDSLKKQFDAIKDGIVNINKQIVICIDDLDRLDKKEIIEVIRLIRNTANFSNTVFIVTYDKEYVESATKDINEYGGDTYLEKIFQQIVHLPTCDSDSLKQKMVFLMTNEIGNQVDHWLSPLLFKTPYNYPEFEIFFHHIRDITRFVNSFSLPFMEIKDDINEIQFYYLQILQFKYPEIYELLEKDVYPMKWLSSVYFTLQQQNDQIGNVIVMRLENETNNPVDKLKSQYKIHQYINNNEALKGDIDVIIKILEILFPHSYLSRFQNSIVAQDDIVPKHFKGMGYEANLKKYFSLRNFEDNISDIELRNAFTLPFDKLKDYIDKWVEEKKHETLGNYFRLYDTYKSREEYEKIIQCIMYFANKSLPGNNNILGFSQFLLWNRLLFSPVKNLYKSKDEHREFVFNQFENAETPAVFHSRFIAEILKKWDSNTTVSDEFPLPQDLLQSFNIEYLRKYLKTLTQLTISSFWMYHCCDHYDKDARTSMGDPVAGGELIGFAKKKDPKYFLVYMIEHNRASNTYSLNHNVRKLFGSYDNFEVFLTEINRKNAYYKEFMEFYNKTKQEDYTSVQFDNFKHLPVLK